MTKKSAAELLYKYSVNLKKMLTPAGFANTVKERRRSGHTTGGILRAIGLAMQAPGDEIIYIDHYGRADPRIFLRKAEEIITSLQLQSINLQTKNGNLVIRSDWYGIQDPDNWKGAGLPKE